MKLLDGAESEQVLWWNCKFLPFKGFMTDRQSNQPTDGLEGCNFLYTSSCSPVSRWKYDHPMSWKIRILEEVYGYFGDRDPSQVTVLDIQDSQVYLGRVFLGLCWNNWMKDNGKKWGGWMDGRTYGWMDGMTDGWRDGRTDKLRWKIRRLRRKRYKQV